MGKTRSVRIDDAEAERLEELIEAIGGSINGFVQRAVKNYVETYYPVLMEASRTLGKREAQKLSKL